MSETQTYRTSETVLAPSFTRTFQDPSVELNTRRLLESYFGPEGLINRPIPVPERGIAGLSPLEIEARNLAGGLGGFGQQLAEAQEMYRAAGQGFDPATAGLFADPRARELYEQSMQAYDPAMGERFVDPRATETMRGAAEGIGAAAEGIAGQVGGAQTGAAEAAERARRQVGMAGRDLRAA